MYRAYASRGNRDNQYDNKEVIRKMVTLRLEKAQLLGYPTYAEYVLTDRMAQNTETVNTFLGVSCWQLPILMPWPKNRK